MVSATMPYDKLLLAKLYLRQPINLSIGIAGVACRDITQTFINVKRSPESHWNAKMAKLLEVLSTVHTGTLIFVDKQMHADELAVALNRKGISSTSVHGGRSELDRTIHWNEFRRGERSVMVATDVAARGIGM